MKKIPSLISTCQNFLVKKTSSTSESMLLAIFTCLAFFIALRAMYIQHGAINVDSVLYFEAARLFSIGEWKQGTALFGWPLYSALIAVLHNLTGLSFQSAAQCLTAIFFAITAFSFITLIRLAGGNKTTIICGAALLLSSSYIVGDVLPMLLRDQGFWAFFLTGLIFFIKFYRDGKLQDALFWQLSCILAMLFRIEAITFLALLPFALFVNPSLTKKQRLGLFLKAHTLNLLAVAALLITLTAIPSLSLADFGRLQEVWALSNQGLHNIAQQFTEKSTLMGKDVLGPFLDDYGSTGLMLALIGIVLLKVAKTVGWVSVGLIALSLKDKKARLKPDTQLIFIFVSSLALLNMATILLRSYVLSSRYIIALGFILLIFSSFALAALFNSAKADSVKAGVRNPKKWLLVIIIIILSLTFLKNLAPKPQSYANEKGAVEWVKQNTPKDSSVFYVSPRARYYAGVPYAGTGYDYWAFTSKAIADGSIQNYDYLVINMDNRYPEREKQLTEALINHELIKEFTGFKSRKKIMIFVKKTKK